MLRTLLLLAILLQTAGQAQAQLFKKLTNRVADKVAQRAEDKLVEELSEEIANRAMRPLDKAFDDMFRAQYKEQYGEEWDDSEYEGDPEAEQAAMTAMMSSMFGNVDIPEQFSFDYTIEFETYDYGAKKPNTAIMMISTTSTAFGMKTEAEGESATIIYDNDNMYLFNEKEKTVMAMGGIMGMASAISSAAIEENMPQLIKFEKTGKSKKILGYSSDQFKIETDEDKGEAYISTDLPFDWKDAFGGMMEQLAPNYYKEHPEYKIDGMLLEAKSKRKSDKKETKWITKDISNKTVTIKSSNYKNALSN
ncbi:MAG: DUF4412 domain-containing protein [Bacteroidota bacterium]